VSSTNAEAIQRVRVAWSEGDSGYLMRALTDPVTRSWAARYLGKLGAIEAIPPLLRLLHASNPHARMAGADALGMLEATEAAEPLAELAEEDPDEAVRSRAVTALGRIGDERTVPLLIRLLASPSRWVRMNAAEALGRFADESGVPAVRAAGRREAFLSRGVYRAAIRRMRHRPARIPQEQREAA
jgi:HEAT repeat protein